MKSAAVIDRIEQTLPQKLRACRYCKQDAREYVRQDVNFKGEQGFIATVKCTGCGASVFAFGLDIHSALVMAKSYWEKGVLDA